MVTLASLWLPILLSAVAVFVVSSVLHMMTPWHAGEYPPVPHEGEVMAALRPYGIPPGDYAMPGLTSAKEMGTPEFAERMRQGPVMFLTVRPNGMPSMTSSLLQWFCFALVVSVLAGYVASRALPIGAPYLGVFRFAGAAAFGAYALGGLPSSVWYSRKWSTTLKHAADGVLYAMVTGGVFGAMWPE